MYLISVDKTRQIRAINRKQALYLKFDSITLQNQGVISYLAMIS